MLIILPSTNKTELGFYHIIGFSTQEAIVLVRERNSVNLDIEEQKLAHDLHCTIRTARRRYIVILGKL
jgi:hypothetical protein